MPDYGSEVMAEALAQRALAKPVYAIPIIPASSGNQYRHQDHMDMKDYKKVRWQGQNGKGGGRGTLLRNTASKEVVCREVHSQKWLTWFTFMKLPHL